MALILQGRDGSAEFADRGQCIIAIREAQGFDAGEDIGPVIAVNQIGIGNGVGAVCPAETIIAAVA